MNDKLRRGLPSLLASAFVCAVGIVAVWSLVRAALAVGIDGVATSAGIGVILAIVLAFTGVKIKDVLFR